MGDRPFLVAESLHWRPVFKIRINETTNESGLGFRSLGRWLGFMQQQDDGYIVNRRADGRTELFFIIWGL